MRIRLLLFVRSFTIIFNLLLATNFAAYSQNPVAAANDQLRALFSGLDKPTIHPNALYEMGVHVVDSTYYGTNIPDTLIYDTWNKIYEEIRWCTYDTAQMLRHDSIHLRTLKWNKDTVVMALLGYDYYTFLDSALTTNTYFDFDTVNNILIDKYPRPGYPYATNKIFAASPTDYYLAYKDITFRIDSSFHFFDQWNYLEDSDTLKMNFGDGSGWHKVDKYTVNHVSISYPSNGKYTVTTNVINLFGQVYRTSQSVVIIEAESTTDGPDSLIVGIPGITAGISILV